MNWPSAAILSAATFGLVNVIDSHLISKRMSGLRAFLLSVSVFHLTYGLVLFYLFPLPEGIGAWPILVTLASGVIRAAGVIIMLYNLKKEEVSRVIPVVYTYPVFVAIMAVPLLGETLYSLQWLAIVIVVAGAVMVSTKKSPSGSTTWMGKQFLLLFVSSLLLAVADITSKYALAYISFWNMFSLTTFCIVGIFLLVSIRPHVIRQLTNMKQKQSTIALLVFNEVLAPVGILLSFWALERGPVSLVATITGSRPMFVVIFALILGYIFPRFLIRSAGREMLALRLIATAMIVGGIAIIYLA